MTSPRVCIVSHELAPFYGAGIGVHANQLARAMRDIGCEVHVVTGEHPDLHTRTDSRLDGVRVHSVDMDHARKLCGHEHPQLQHTWNDIYARAVVDAVHMLTRDTPFDVIEYPEFGGEGGLFGQWRASGKLNIGTMVVRLHTPLELCMELNNEHIDDTAHAPVFRLEKQSILCADAVVSPSHALLDRVKNQLGADKCWPNVERVIPNPFDAASFISSHDEQKTQCDKTTVLYVGRLEWRKGVDTLVRAWARVAAQNTDAQLLFVGSNTHTGPTPDSEFHSSSMRSHLDSLVSDLQLQDRVRFLERVDRTALAPMMHACRAVCLPSRFENFPTVVLEALSAGAPVVASNAGGQAEILEHGITGLLFEAEDDDALASALMRALDDDSLAMSARAHGPTRVRMLCDPDHIARSMLDITKLHKEHAIDV